MASTAITLGHVEAHEKLTARLYFKPDTDSNGGVADVNFSGYYDLGNVLDYKFTPERTYRTRMRTLPGARIVNDEEVDTVHDRWEFTLDESDRLTQELLTLGQNTSGVTQDEATAPAGTYSIAKANKDCWYWVGKTALNTVVVKKNVTALTLNTDYTVDADAGLIRLLPGASGFTNGDTLAVTFGCPARFWQTWDNHLKLRWEGSILIHESNQHSKEVLRSTSFRGVIMATAFPEQTGEFGKFVLRATPLEAPTALRRYSAR